MTTQLFLILFYLIQFIIDILFQYLLLKHRLLSTWHYGRSINLIWRCILLSDHVSYSGRTIAESRLILIHS